MTTKQENQFTMMVTSRDYAAVQTAITGTLPNFSTYYGILTSGITNIQTARDIQEGDKTGVTGNKKDLRIALTSIALDYVDRLVAYAKNTKNKALETEVYFTKSDLDGAADTIFKDRAQLLYNRAQTNLAALPTYFIVAATQTAFQNAINAYAAAIPKPSLAYNDKQTAGENIAANITSVLDALDMMDALAKMVRHTQSTFYSGWIKAREVPKSGSGTMAFRVAVTDISGQPIPLAAIQVTSLGANGHTTKRKSSDNGNAQIKNLTEGKYTATFAKSGYKEQTASFSITHGERTTLQVKMESEG